MQDIIKDSIILLSNIYNATPPKDKFAIVNIAKNNTYLFSYPSYLSIPTSFGYKYDYTPNVLIDGGIIEYKLKNKWFVEISEKIEDRKLLNSKFINKEATEILIQKKFINKNQSVYQYYAYKKSNLDFGPISAGQYTVIINMTKLKNYISSEEQKTPDFSIISLTKGILQFLGETVNISGNVNVKSMELLIENINSIVSKEDFYNVREDETYKSAIQREKSTTATTTIHNITDSTFHELKKKISANKKLSNSLIFAQQNGYGIFINKGSI